MIHTLELIQEIQPEQIHGIMTGFEFPQCKINKFFKRQGQIFGCFHKLSRQHPGLGIKQISLFRQEDTIAAGCSYYCLMRVEPQMVLQRERTVDLFMATEENVQALSDNFHTIMNMFIDDDGFPNIVDLAAWDCRRIDYTVNLKFSDDAKARLFLELTKKTSRYSRTTKKVQPGIASKEQSTAEGNGSIKNLLYDKKKQIQETYGGVPDDELQQLIDNADGTIRFELQCKKRKIIGLKNRYGFASRSIINFLNEDIANDLLQKQYRQTVGSGDFYSFYHAQKRINEAPFGQKKKDNLVNFLRLVAQARHVDAALEQFVAGGTKIKRMDIVVEGSRNTFCNRLLDIAFVNINPVLIPKERKVTFLQNPIDQLEIR